MFSNENLKLKTHLSQKYLCKPIVYAISTKNSEVIAVALFPHKSRADNELTLAVKDVVTVIEKDEKTGWCKGKLKDKEGIFPSRCVQILQLGKVRLQ